MLQGQHCLSPVRGGGKGGSVQQDLCLRAAGHRECGVKPQDDGVYLCVCACFECVLACVYVCCVCVCFVLMRPELLGGV